MFTEEDIKDLCEMHTFRGLGQLVNQGERGIRLSIKELCISAECSFHRSHYQNREACLKMILDAVNTIPETVVNHLINEKKNATLG